MDLVEVRHVERVQGASLNRGQAEVFFIPPADHAAIGRGDNIDAPRPKPANKVALHGVLVNILTKAAHADRRTPMVWRYGSCWLYHGP